MSGTKPGPAGPGRDGHSQDRPGQDGHAAGGLRAVLAALGANLGITATKFVAFAVTGSVSMLAESAHSLADSGNQGLLLLGRSR
ncbi:MAG: cation transporter, partial [Actinobacteria bacterium]|nr:cation transporter [Actinomycetota bacterium]